MAAFGHGRNRTRSGSPNGLQCHLHWRDRQHPVTTCSRSRVAQRRSSDERSGPVSSGGFQTTGEHQGRTDGPCRSCDHRSVGTSSPRRRLEGPSVIPVPIMVRRSREVLGRLQWQPERRLHKDHGLQVHLQRRSSMELEVAVVLVPGLLGLPTPCALGVRDGRRCVKVTCVVASCELEGGRRTYPVGSWPGPWRRGQRACEPVGATARARFSAPQAAQGATASVTVAKVSGTGRRRLERPWRPSHRRRSGRTETSTRPARRGTRAARPAPPVNDQRLSRHPHPRATAAMLTTAPRLFLLGDQPAEVARRSGMAGGTSLRQQPLRRDPIVRRLHPATTNPQRLVSAAPIGWPIGNLLVARRRGVCGLDDRLHGHVSRAAERGRSPIAAHLPVSGDHIIYLSILSLAFFNGQRPRSTRRTKGGDFEMATNGDLHLAASGDFSMATDSPTRPEAIEAAEAVTRRRWLRTA